MSPAVVLPDVAAAICASVLPDWSSVVSAELVTPRYDAAASRSSDGPCPWPPGPCSGAVLATAAVKRAVRPAISVSACACVSLPAVTAALISAVSCVTSAAIRPAVVLPDVAAATWASVLPDWRSVMSAAFVTPR